MGKIRSIKALILLVFLLTIYSSYAVADGPSVAPPPTAMVALGSNGWHYVGVDGSGNLYTSGSPAPLSGPSVAPPPMALVALGPNGWTWVTVDANGNLNVTGGGGGGGTWGSITGTLSAQTDLQNALNAKVATTVTINGHALSSNVTVTNADLGAVPTTTTVNGHALSSNVVVSASDLTTGTLPHAQLPTLLSGDIPNNAANTSGLAGTATAAAAAGTECSAGQAARGVDASWNGRDCFTPAGTGANTALSNLSGVAINTTLLPATAASSNIGTAPLPWGDLFVGGAANHSFHFDSSAVASNVAVAVPNAASNTVQGIANPSDTQVVNYVGTDGVQHRIAGGGLSGLTTGYIPQATSATGIGNSSPILDNGVTTANTLTYAGSAGFAAAAFTGTATNLPVNVPNGFTGQLTHNAPFGPAQQTVSNLVATYAAQNNVSSGEDMPNTVSQGPNGFASFVYIDGNTVGNLWYCEMTDADGATAPNCTEIDASGSAQDPYLVGIASADSLPRILYNLSTDHSEHFVQCTTASPTGAQTRCTANNNNAAYTGTGSYYGALDMTASDGFARMVITDNTGIRYLKCTTASCSSGVGSTLVLLPATGLAPVPVAMHLDTGGGGDGFCRIAYVTLETNTKLNYIQCLADPPAGGVGVGWSQTTSILTNTADTYTNPDFVLTSSHFALIVEGNANGTNPKYVQCTNAVCSTSVITTISEIARPTNLGNFGDAVEVALGNDGFLSFFSAGGWMWEKQGSYFVHCTNISCSTRNVGFFTPYGLYPLGFYFNSTDHFPRVVGTTASMNNLQYFRFLQADYATISVGNVQQQTPIVYGSVGSYTTPSPVVNTTRLQLAAPSGWPAAAGNVPTLTIFYDNNTSTGRSGGFKLCGLSDTPPLTNQAVTNSIMFTAINNGACASTPFMVNQNAGNGALTLTGTTASFWFGTAVINNSGFFQAYGNKTLVGDGVPYQVGHANLVAFSTTQGPTNLLAAPVASHAYRVNYYIWQAASGSGGTCATNATVTPSFTWNDPSATAQTNSIAAINIPPTLATGVHASGSFNAVTASGTAIAYTLTWANGNCSTQPTAQAQIWVEAAN